MSIQSEIQRISGNVAVAYAAIEEKGGVLPEMQSSENLSGAVESIPQTQRVDTTPIGTVISFMGTTAPQDYLACDGAEHSISDYPRLAAFFTEQFGAASHFGGDGITTFAVPDMRNLFLRGYRGDAEDQLSGEIGEKQDGTRIPNVYYGNNRSELLVFGDEASAPPLNTEMPEMSGARHRVTLKTDTISPNTRTTYYTARPANMAILYCVKAVESSGGIDEYDTDDGWHVRKHSDGYVEMTLSVNETYESSAWAEWGSIYSISASVPGQYIYPVTLKTRYAETMSLNTTWAVAPTYGGSPYKDRTGAYGFIRATPVNENMQVTRSFTVFGRWK